MLSPLAAAEAAAPPACSFSEDLRFAMGGREVDEVEWSAGACGPVAPGGRSVLVEVEGGLAVAGREPVCSEGELGGLAVAAAAVVEEVEEVLSLDAATAAVAKDTGAGRACVDVEAAVAEACAGFELAALPPSPPPALPPRKEGRTRFTGFAAALSPAAAAAEDEEGAATRGAARVELEESRWLLDPLPDPLDAAATACATSCSARTVVTGLAASACACGSPPPRKLAPPSFCW